jgi:hypothetical protein
MQYFYCQAGVNMVKVELSLAKSIYFMRKFLAIVIVGLGLVLPSALQAQTYSIPWYTIAGGGGSSSGTNGSTNYTVSGTIGQPATSTMAGGNYSITGGFWSILSVVQISGSPFLTITHEGANSAITWTTSAGGYFLQQSSTLLSNSWATSSATVTTNNGTNFSVTVPSSSGHEYFRLVNTNL